MLIVQGFGHTHQHHNTIADFTDDLSQTNYGKVVL